VETRKQAEQRGLVITQIQWEDVSRYKDAFGKNISCWGNSISDFSLRVSNRMCPVIRYPNFEDQTVMMPARHFQVSVGGEPTGLSKDSPISRIPLLTYLKEHIKDSTGSVVDLSCALDNEVGILTAGQQCILPLKDGSCEFNPHAYNYQTISSSDPGILFVVSVSQGTSPQTSTSSDQELYFNWNGEATNLVAKRLKDDRAERKVQTTGAMTQEELDRNWLIIYSVPLVQERKTVRHYSIGGIDLDSLDSLECTSLSLESLEYKSDVMIPCSASFHSNSNKEKSIMRMEAQVSRATPPPPPPRGLDHAMLSIGAPLFKFPNDPSLVKLKRDETKPVRATVQFYSVTDEPKVDGAVFDEIKTKLEKLSARATS
jgi:hypothetical protein